MPERSFRDLVETRDLKIGMFLVEFATPGIGQILRNANADFAYVDMEHSGFGYETVNAVLRSLHGAGIASLVRLPSAQYHDVSRALNVGAHAIIPPMMTAALAEEVSQFIKYPPAGARGAIFGAAHDDYVPGLPDRKIEAANRKTSFIALVESRQGVENVERLAAMDTVDGIFIGHFDLSCDLGVPWQFDHPTFTATVQRITETVKGSGKGDL